MQQSLPPPIKLNKVIAKWPPQARKAARAIAKVVGADNGAAAVKFIDSTGDIIRGAAQFVFMQITEAEKRIGDIEDELLYEDGGLGDAMLALVFHFAQQAGVEGADRQDAYESARELLDDLASFEDSEEPPSTPDDMDPGVPQGGPPPAEQEEAPLMAV